MTVKLETRRQTLMDDISRLAGAAIFGTLSESYRTCGRPKCRCHQDGIKHGPHFQISYRGENGRTTGYYVPKAAEEAIRRAVAAWNDLQARLRDLAELNKDAILAEVRNNEIGRRVPPAPAHPVADRPATRRKRAVARADGR